MKMNRLLCTAFNRLTRKYNSYVGTVGHIAPNRLNHRFTTKRPYQKVLTDVTEIRWGSGTKSERAYFTAYIYVYSGEILTWNIDLHPTVEFVTKPLDELLQNRPELNYRMAIHADQCFQYQNYEYVARLKNNRVFQSMSRKATCLDNTMAESIFHIVKVGTVHNNHYQSYDELKSVITNYVYYYNNRRIKTKLAGKTPVQYRNLSDQLAA
ncbi:transposase [Weissella cibaria]|uniref:transposase n=1 Tax=Weissella cibaria TaxID=137591 RepID=UPI0039E30130